MERPALKRLLADIKSGKVQIVVVYKVDRLTRSLADFAKIVEVFDAHGVSFVSVTQQFNTTTSMGRLTLNVLLSFAQFEREVTGERIRDKIAASKAKGMWMGGNVPLGYDVRDRKLVINEAEAETVRLIFARYADLGSVTQLHTELNRHGIRSNPHLRERPPLRRQAILARHAVPDAAQQVVSRRGGASWQCVSWPARGHRRGRAMESVQDKLAANRHARMVGARPRTQACCPVSSSIAGRPLTPTHANKSGRRYRYYISASLLTRKAGRGSSCACRPARWKASFSTGCDCSSSHVPRSWRRSQFQLQFLSARVVENAFNRSEGQAAASLTGLRATRPELVRAIVPRVTIEPSQISVAICPIRLADILKLPSPDDRSSVPLFEYRR